MKKTLILSILFIILSALNVEAQRTGGLKVAVFDPSSPGSSIDEGTIVAVREIVSSVFVNSGEYSIVERSLLDKVMHEARFSNTDVVDDSQATELGKLAGADKVVLSVLSQAGSRNMLSVKLIDVETATVEKQKAKVVLVADLLDEIEPLTMALLGKEMAPSTRVAGNARPVPNSSNQTANAQSTTRNSSLNNLFKLGKSNQKEANAETVEARPVTVNTGTKISSKNRAPIVHSVMNLINQKLGAKTNRYRTDEERFEQEKSDGELKEFVRFSAKPVTTYPQVDEGQVLFFCLGDSKGGNDLLFLFVDGTMIGASTVLRGFAVTVADDNLPHQVTIWRGTSKIYSKAINFAQKKECLLAWNGKNIQLN